jgi:hypothetical protein
VMGSEEGRSEEGTWFRDRMSLHERGRESQREMSWIEGRREEPGSSRDAGGRIESELEQEDFCLEDGVVVRGVVEQGESG